MRFTICGEKLKDYRKQTVRAVLINLLRKKYLARGTADTVKVVCKQLCEFDLEGVKGSKVCAIHTCGKSGVSDVHFLEFMRQILTICHGYASVKISCK